MKNPKSKPQPSTETPPSPQPETASGRVPAPYEALADGVEFVAVGLCPVLVPDKSPTEPPKKKLSAVRLRIKDGVVLDRIVYEPETFGAAELDVKREIGLVLLKARTGEIHGK